MAANGPSTSGTKSIRQTDETNADTDGEDEVGHNDYIQDDVYNPPVASDEEPDQEEAGNHSDSEIEEDEDSEIVPPTWCTTTPGMHQIEFTRGDTLLVPIPGEGRPIDFFRLLLDDVMVERMCSFSNKYAFEVFNKPNLQPKSRINRWKDVQVEEMIKFIGLILHTGTIRLNRLQDYWKTDFLFNMPVFRSYMSRDRFLSILRCLHFYGSTQQNDPLEKVRYLVEFFNNKMREIYYPQKELSLGEALVLWRGRLYFRQYIKGKRHKYGIRLYTLTEHQGLILKFAVYTGRDDKSIGGKGHTEKVVLYLLKDYLNKGHAVYMDNFYNSYQLASKLLANDTYCTGTLRANRKHIPDVVKSTVLHKGESIARYSNGVMCAKWKNQREVMYISTEFDNEQVEFVGKGDQKKSKPHAIVKYNSHMSGVDRTDQMLSYYPCDRKTLRWYEKITIHTIQMMLLNSFTLYNMSRPRLTYYDFRLEVIRCLLGPNPLAPIESPAQKRLRQSMHEPVKITEKNKDNRTIRKRCRQCTVTGKYQRSLFVVAFARTNRAYVRANASVIITTLDKQ
ncbi:piggyBac transposable element-derived protein 4-like [Homalodisca vitripennis]|uniref:piggyBac transposable element-derived protein 4-like n=1 Tax=Homalodisca vitripennis TaxID=197043 RepID=UPI001EEAF53E|nr:piggyBac transposable element-derived protein 4-like [Homalodisca vitripennis]